MGLVARTLDILQAKRDKAIAGGVNCIPSPLKRFRDDFPGVEQETYYIVTATQKGAKTQFSSYLFLYNSIMFAYNHPELIRVKIFYVNLEESEDRIMMRFMSFLLFTGKCGKVRLSPAALRSIKEDEPLPQEIIDMLRDEEPFKSVLKFFEDHVEFIDSKNPTGIYKTIRTYSATHGKDVMTDYEAVDKTTGEIKHVKKFDHYEPDDPDEYVIIYTDHISKLTNEVHDGIRSNLRETIQKYSDYMMEVRDKYKYIPVVIQQQSTETQNLDAFKNNKIRPTAAGLADNKATGRDANYIFGLTNPSYFEIPEYCGYDITRLRDSARFLELIAGREGTANNVVGLYFDGAVCYFNELPKPTDTNKLNEVYATVRDRNRVTEESEHIGQKKPVRAGFLAVTLKSIKEFVSGIQ